MDGTSIGPGRGDDRPRAPRWRTTAGALLVLAGGGTVLLMTLLLVFRTVLVVLLIPDVPVDPDRGGLPACTTWACIEEARTVYLALAMAVVALIAVAVAVRRGGWAPIAACLVLAVGVGMPVIDPDLEPLIKGVSLGLVLAAVGTWLRLRTPFPPRWRVAASRSARGIWDTQVVPAFRDAFGKNPPPAPSDLHDPRPDHRAR